MHRILISVLLITFCNASALAQEALGDGRALDQSTSSLGRINQQENLPVGVRNNDIRRTGVLRGRDFNEGIGRGYGDTSGTQLLADAANDDNEKDYLDALYNSPWYWNNWSKPSAQWLSQGDRSYFNPNFIDEWSTAPKQMSFGRNIRTYSHAWSAESAQKYGGKGEVAYPDTWSKRQVNQYNLGQMLGNGTTQDSLTTSTIPVGDLRSMDSFGYLAASPMTGVSLETTDRPTSALGFSAWDDARLTQDVDNGIGSNVLIQPWRTEENRLDQTTVNRQVDVSPQYNKVLQTVADRAITETSDDGTKNPNSLEWLEEQYFALQDELAGIDALDNETLEQPDSNEVTLDEETIDTLAATLRHGEQIGQFAGEHQTRFDELVQLGEDELKKGNYFNAQRRFNQALQFIHGHPLATAGLGHADIGAGLYLSAGYVLHSLLTFQPEMIDVEYDSNLLPPRIELVRAAVTIQNRLDSERDAGTYGFLLAYLGHQLHDQEMVERGLGVLKMYSDSDDPFVSLLQKIWGE